MAQRAWWPCERRSIRCSAAADPAITRLSNGHYYNQRLGAHNVWEVELDASLVDEAGAIVSEGSPFAQLVGGGAAYVPITTRRGDHFFAHRVSQWNSNICWISCDNARAFDRFNRLFSRMGLAEYFGGVVPHARSLQMYNAFYVTRSWCKEHNFHTDYSARVGTNALTLITPVADYREKDSFQLSYEKRGAEHLVGQRGTPPELARYTYKKGTAIVFGSGFVHSTEPGAAAEGETHAYLCFTFGTDSMASWSDITSTIGTQSRLVREPNGELALSAFGKDLEQLDEARRQGIVSEEEFKQLYHEGLY